MSCGCNKKTSSNVFNTSNSVASNNSNVVSNNYVIPNNNSNVLSNSSNNYVVTSSPNYTVTSSIASGSSVIIGTPSNFSNNNSTSLPNYTVQNNTSMVNNSTSLPNYVVQNNTSMSNNLPNYTVQNNTSTNSTLSNNYVPNNKNISRSTASVSSVNGTSRNTGSRCPATYSLFLVTSVNPISYRSVNEVVTFTYNLVNTGNTTLAGPFTITDSLVGTFGATGNLAPNSSMVITKGYRITAANTTVNSITSMAKAKNAKATSNTTTTTLRSTVTLPPGFVFDKEITKIEYLNDFDRYRVTYKYNMINNTRNELLGPFQIYDDKIANIPKIPGSLAVGATASLEVTGTYQGNGNDCIEIMNIAYVIDEKSGLYSNSFQCTFRTLTCDNPRSSCGIIR